MAMSCDNSTRNKKTDRMLAFLFGIQTGLMSLVEAGAASIDHVVMRRKPTFHRESNAPSLGVPEGVRFVHEAA